MLQMKMWHFTNARSFLQCMVESNPAQLEAICVHVCMQRLGRKIKHNDQDDFATNKHLSRKLYNLPRHHFKLTNPVLLRIQFSGELNCAKLRTVPTSRQQPPQPLRMKQAPLGHNLSSSHLNPIHTVGVRVMVGRETNFSDTHATVFV